MSRQLLKLCRTIPLTKLKQGGTLSIQSKLPMTRVHIIPEWRDSGELSMIQYMGTSDREADVSVTHESDKMTSLGRTEPHFSVSIFPKETATQAAVIDKGSVANAPSETDVVLDKVDSSMVMTDDGDIVPDSEKWHASNVKRVKYSDGITHVSEQSTSQEPSLTLTAVLPEKINVSCELLNGGDIVIDKKVEGDANLVTSDGDILVSKLRGHQVRISAQGASSTVLAANLLEAQKLNIDTRGRVRAKRIHGNHIHVKVDRKERSASFVSTNDVDDEESLLDISSLYVASSGSADLSVSSAMAPERRAVRVKSHHGHVAVETNVPPSNTDPCVELGGVNGSFDVLIRNPSFTKALAGRINVDSLARESVSVLSADAGDVSITLDRKVEADLRMVSSSEIHSFETRAILLEDDDPNHIESALQDLDAKSTRANSDTKISIETNAFTARTNDKAYRNIDYVDGWVENKSNEPDSRFDLMTKGGKIQLQGAAEQALQGFSSSGGGNIARPLVAIATNGTIALESLSWFGAIARRYNLDEERDDLGRTATRSGRPLVPKE